MVKRPKRKWFQVYLIGACIVISLLSASGIRADSNAYVSDPKLTIILEPPKPKYLTPEEIKEMRGQGISSPAPMQPKYILPPKSPSGAEVSMPSQRMGMLTGGPGAGKAIFVYDGLNRLIRAIYDQTTVIYTYDKAGNRLTKKILLTKPMGTVDFDGDAINDIAIYRTATGYWRIIPSSPPGTPYEYPWGVSTDLPVPGDYDGDGKTDIAVWRPGDGYWYILRSSDQGVTQTQWEAGYMNDIPVPGDYDGDGNTDLAVWRPGDGYWYIKRSMDGGVTQTQWGSGGLNDIPVPGDYDGDGKTDIAVWRPGDGYWYILQSSDQGVTQTQWGAGYMNDIPVPGDYDGDRKTDLAVWRPGDGYWYIIRSSDQGITQTQWGAGYLNDIPVPGDYDGDRKTDLAVYRVTNGYGYWYIYPSGGGSPYVIQWGGDPSDIPVSTILPSMY